MTKRDRKKASSQNSKKSVSYAHMISRGATGVALTAGVVAVGAALADKKTRESLTRGAKSMMNAVGDAATSMSEQAGDGYRVVASQVTRSRRSRRRTKGSSMSR